MKAIIVKDSKSLLNGGKYNVIEELPTGYFIECHGRNCREFVLKEHAVEVMADGEYASWELDY